MTKNFLYALGAASALALSATAASAATVEITNITANWVNMNPGSITTSGTASSASPTTTSIRWGTPYPNSWNPKSGYDFTVANNPPNPNDGSTVGLDIGDVFTLGEFTHLNYPVTGTSLNSAQLAVTFSFYTEEDSTLQTLNAVYDFKHLETTNGSKDFWGNWSGPKICDNTEPNGTGVNINGCADKVTISTNASTETLMIGDIEYTFYISGFLDAGDDDASVFWTKEKASNSAHIQVSFDRFVPTPAPVPLPAAGWLLMGGIGALGLARRRRKAA